MSNTRSAPVADKDSLSDDNATLLQDEKATEQIESSSPATNMPGPKSMRRPFGRVDVNSSAQPSIFTKSTKTTGSTQKKTNRHDAPPQSRPPHEGLCKENARYGGENSCSTLSASCITTTTEASDVSNIRSSIFRPYGDTSKEKNSLWTLKRANRIMDDDDGAYNEFGNQPEGRHDKSSDHGEAKESPTKRQKPESVESLCSRLDARGDEECSTSQNIIQWTDAVQGHVSDGEFKIFHGDAHHS